MSTLPTTLQVRSIMAHHGARGMYTNKTTGHTGNERRVKCYYTTQALVDALCNLVGAENVKVTEGCNEFHGRGQQGVVVKCKLAI